MNQPYQPYPTSNCNRQPEGYSGNQYNQVNPQNQFQTPSNNGFIQHPSSMNNNNYSRPINNNRNSTHNRFINILNQQNASQQTLVNLNNSPQTLSPQPQQQQCFHNQPQPINANNSQPYPNHYLTLSPPLQQPLSQPLQNQQYQPPPPPFNQQFQPSLSQQLYIQLPLPPPPPQPIVESPIPQPPPESDRIDLYSTEYLDSLKTCDLYDTTSLLSMGPIIKSNKLHLNANQKIKLIEKIYEKINKFISSFSELDEESFKKLFETQKIEWISVCDYLTSISSNLKNKNPRKVVKKWIKQFKRLTLKKFRNVMMKDENLLVQHRDLASLINKIKFRYDLTDIDESNEEDSDDNEGSIPKVECQTCSDNVLLRDAIVLGCKDHHAFCKECFKNSFIESIKKNEIMCCPFKDKYKITLDDFDRLYEDEPPDVKATLRQTYCEILDKDVFDKNFIGCPVRGCPGYVHKDDINERACLICSVCHFEFCPNCQKMHHGKTSCDDYAKLTGDYLKWEATGRDRRLREKGVVIAATREAEEKQRKRQEEIQQRLRDLQADENWKAQNCRYCPNCQRVVYKVDGCDLMVCGRNYHGGDVQNGCGQGFRWTQAQPYQPRTDFNPQNEDYRRNIPPLSNNITHNRKFKCNICNKAPIVGIRFKCLNCRDFYLCEECECKEEVRNNHNKGEKENHVFQLINNPNME